MLMTVCTVTAGGHIRSCACVGYGGAYICFSYSFLASGEFAHLMPIADFVPYLSWWARVGSNGLRYKCRMCRMTSASNGC